MPAGAMMTTIQSESGMQPSSEPSPKILSSIRGAFADIIDGRTVKRSKHELSFEGKDYAEYFIQELGHRGYMPGTVGQLDVQPGERVPAFYLNDGIAYFGWVFWEQFTGWKLRKLWGSVIKNALGDWEIQIPATRKTIIYANPSHKLEMDIDHPPEF